MAGGSARYCENFKINKEAPNNMKISKISKILIYLACNLREKIVVTIIRLIFVRFPTPAYAAAGFQASTIFSVVV